MAQNRIKKKKNQEHYPLKHALMQPLENHLMAATFSH